MWRCSAVSVNQSSQQHLPRFFMSPGKAMERLRWRVHLVMSEGMFDYKKFTLTANTLACLDCIKGTLE